jgi:diguanylate cyclase (GGDEF)-like protein
MATAVPGSSDALSMPRTKALGLVALARGTARRALGPRLMHDPFLVYTASLAPIALIVAIVSGRAQGLWMVLILTPIFVGIQALLGVVPTRLRPMTPLGWSFLRLATALLYVAGLVTLVGGANQPLASLYLAVVVAAAALGTRQAVVIGALASLIYLAPELARPGTDSYVALRGLALAGVGIVVAVGTRRLVIAVERTARDLRSAMVSERRRSRQIGAMEAVSRLLVSEKATPELLDGALGILVEQFGYHYVSIYLQSGDRIWLGAQRGYDHPPEWFDGSAGIVGRVMRGHQLVHVLDVSKEPDYIAVFDGVVSEVCAPLMVGDQFLGLLNVEARHPLDRTDRDLVATLADRVATVVAMRRDREALGERAAIFSALHQFTQAVSATLDLGRLAAVLVEATHKVVPADIVAFTILDRETGRYLLRAATDVDESMLGREVRPGESLAGRAIRDRTVVIDDHLGKEQFPAAYRDSVDQMDALGAGVPLVRDSVVVGAMSLVRRDRTDLFRPIEREAMELLARHAALAIANAFLHAEVEQLAVRDPLTNLFNRRHFDEALERVLAGWRRAAPSERRPVAVIMFDLDHFGLFNKQHGHQVGDQVLRAFAGVLQRRFRASDLLSRFGGEEFVVVLEGATRDDAVRVADEVRADLARELVLSDDGQQLAVTVSAGCAQVDEGEPTREHLLRTADVGLFMAKRAGRDRVVAA